ncbi:dihydrofolate reductase [Solirubrobacter sp. CPCC 204708]|uniref:Dihydrofolate reductase family protein n=1 Tax=Solirubrobacter deserti TaxID=2282478 RepID=A0ABT4RQI9_9ACTN|nr:dihydrofolate reductase family protein [Solirubrobacter deserti]MBE2320567.1 dihydrofolate reductase [Solirubrobacter deserti]MDA0140804.1 dihydrofolate reductase family protein [Solirubrobacter deserti]
MSKTTFDMSVSLDGYVRRADPSPEEPLGVRGEQLHRWAFGDDERDHHVMAEGGQGTGAVIAGRRTYDDSIRFWGADGPTGARRLPVVVVTHEPPADSPRDGVYRFVTGGIEAALRDAREAAAGKNVTIMGGADLGRQFLAARLIDELSIHLVPVLLGSGTPLFTGLPDGHLQLEPVAAIQSPNATHLRFRVVR